ncbi:MAG: hypothetical protein ABIK28_09385 [Planctomycetota bacterium]
MTPSRRHKARVIRTDAEISSIPVLVEPVESRPQNANHPDPQVRLIREGEDGATVEVTCSCGKKITIHCEYEARKVEVES